MMFLNICFRLTFNLDMINSLLCVILSFFFPILAFVFLFFKLPMFLFGTFYLARRRKRTVKEA